MNNVVNFPKRKEKRKYIKKKSYVIAQIPKFRPIVKYGASGIKEMKTEAISIYMEFLKCYKRPETMFHFIKIPFRKKGDWKYKNVCKYIKQKVGVL